MKLIFAEGRVDVHRAREACKEVAAAIEENPWIANAQAIANYILPAESNGFEGYLRFPFPSENEKASGERNVLRCYFSPRALQPYRIVFVHVTDEGKIGFDVFSHLWAHQTASQLHATGVWNREVTKPVYGAEPLDD
jgi:hypothetical protein